MDNLCHSLIGGTLARAGFNRKTSLATATMIIGANLPDLDVAAVWFGDSIGFRRGITHGIPALILWPFVLTGIVLLWDRFVRRRRTPALPPVAPRALFAAAAVSILTHPFFDWLNTYGMRWLMPLEKEWFYGDSIFIVDIWLWVSLGAGFILAGRQANPRPARLALVFTGGYVAFMMVTSGVIASRVRRQTGVSGAARSLMVAPIPVNPFVRDVLIVQGGSYRRGRTSLFNETLEWNETIAINRDDPAVRLAVAEPRLASFLDWARFPFFLVNKHGARTVVQVSDARYSDRGGGGWASATIEIPTPNPGT